MKPEQQRLTAAERAQRRADLFEDYQRARAEADRVLDEAERIKSEHRKVVNRQIEIEQEQAVACQAAVRAKDAAKAALIDWIL